MKQCGCQSTGLISWMLSHGRTSGRKWRSASVSLTSYSSPVLWLDVIIFRLRRLGDSGFAGCGFMWSGSWQSVRIGGADTRPGRSPSQTGLCWKTVASAAVGRLAARSQPEAYNPSDSARLARHQRRLDDFPTDSKVSVDGQTFELQLQWFVLDRLVKLHPNASWVLLVQDNTRIDWSNLLRLTRQFDYRKVVF